MRGAQGVKLAAASEHQANPWIFANGSRDGSRCHSYSIRIATCSAVLTSTSRAIVASVISIPAETPDEVMNLPSSTHRACLTHSTAAPCSDTHLKASLFEVEI